ncbi:polysaccharide biosynthesis protein [Firmicutes bacterium CAG:194]|nr:polysaccharide biosynthesis protein [Dorea sp. CAG:105]CCZ29020.1 polysaccharide biosynthesis protein [Firmicutes bacterium CAG:194]
MSKKNSIWVGILHMGLGTVLAQMINIVVQPILTRIFPTETLGIYTYLISLATMIIPVASLKLDMLIVSEPNEKEAQYITDACIIINILISLIYAIVIIVGYQVSDNNIFNKYGIIIYVVPVLVFTNGLRFLFISYLNRYKEYKTISIIAIIREAIRAVIQVGAGFLSLGVFSLSMGYAVSPLFGLNIQMRNYLKELKERPRINLKKFKEIVLVKGKRQILFLVPAQFINSFSASLVTISITALFSAKILGYYSAGVRILDIPIVFITSNVSKVCYQRISENVANKKPVLRTLMSVIIVLSAVSIMGFGTLYVIAPRLSEIVFGQGYRVAGEYIRCLCVMYAVRLVATSFAGVYTVFKKQNFELILNILLIVSAGVSYVVCSMFNFEVITYLKFMNTGYTIVYLMMLLGYIVMCKNYDKKIRSVE